MAVEQGPGRSHRMRASFPSFPAERIGHNVAAFQFNFEAMRLVSRLHLTNMALTLDRSSSRPESKLCCHSSMRAVVEG